jgi:REP element-mobilizing transposase RayT
MPRAWNDWYHVVVHAYGSWLRGDPRGWRARHHREDVQGDYKDPPPSGKYDRLLASSKSLMTREAVSIDQELRRTVVEAVVGKLRCNDIEVLVASVDSRHLHLLARFRDRRPRHWVGIAKKHASHLLRQQGLREESGGIWAKRSREEPIADRQHQLNTFRYIHVRRPN